MMLLLLLGGEGTRKVAVAVAVLLPHLPHIVATAEDRRWCGG